MPTFTKDGRTYKIVTERMTDGRLGRTLQRLGENGWVDIISANHSSSTRTMVLCVGEVDAYLRLSV